MRNSLTKVIPLSIAIAASAGFFFTADHNSYAEPAVQENVNYQWISLAPELVSQTSHSKFTGRILSQHVRVLSLPADGILTLANMKSGQVVEAGSIIAKLESSLEQAQVDKAQAELTLKQADYKAKQTLKKKRVSSELQVLQAHRDLKLAESNLTLAKRQLTERQLVAPYKGIIQTTYASEGDYIAKQERLAEVHSLEEVSIELPIANSMINTINLQDAIQVEVDSQTVGARFSHWKPVSSQKFSKIAVLKFTEEFDPFWLGMPVKVQITNQNKSKYLHLGVSSNSVLPGKVANLRFPDLPDKQGVFPYIKTKDGWLIKWNEAVGIPKSVEVQVIPSAEGGN
ncbi:efflux RND transporter periplasmic adaptor subunit [Neptuniibacter sp. QD37_11]|uniref:efflux RND transporter periplasmic adaptor subunit n=1 Tax=Neptuniibacter sp. QD37_11 TaxID=3398209 RepID=UPI0039F535FE